MPPRTVLFVCVENAGRSLMAEALFNATAPEGWAAISAGTRAAHAPHPRTAAMLAEVGVPMPLHPPQNLTPELMGSAGIVVTMGCLDDASCPARLRQMELRDWGIPNPAGLDDAGFRAVRDEIRHRVRDLIEELNGAVAR